MSEVRLHVSGLNAFFDEAAQAARQIDAGREGVSPAAIAFESMDLLLTVLTPNRWRLLRALKASGATSIRKLARTLGRDYRGVHADVVVLTEAGLIEKTSDALVTVPWDRITAEMEISEAA
jgi:predicted transcriptional regulator